MSGLVWDVLIGPQHARKQLVALRTKPGCMFPQSCLYGTVVALYLSVALRMVCCCVKFLDNKDLTHIQHSAGEEIDTFVRQQGLRPREPHRKE